MFQKSKSLFILFSTVTFLFGCSQNTQAYNISSNGVGSSNDLTNEASNQNTVGVPNTSTSKTGDIAQVIYPTMDLLLISGHANLSIDPGAVSGDRYEYAYAQQFVQKLHTYIQQNYPYIHVILEDQPYKVSGEINYMNQVKPDYAISIHFNAGGGTGLEIITPLENKDLIIASTIVKNMKEQGLPLRNAPIYSRSTVNTKIPKEVGVVNSGTNYYGVIQTGTLQGILSEIIEIEFIDNAQAMDTYETRVQQYVEIIGESIYEYYRLTYLD